jgi:hypothetical protein
MAHFSSISVFDVHKIEIDAERDVDCIHIVMHGIDGHDTRLTIWGEYSEIEHLWRKPDLVEVDQGLLETV